MLGQTTLAIMSLETVIAVLLAGTGLTVQCHALSTVVDLTILVTVTLGSVIMGVIPDIGGNNVRMIVAKNVLERTAPVSNSVEFVLTVILVSMETNARVAVALTVADQAKRASKIVEGVSPVLLGITEIHAQTHVALTVLKLPVIRTLVTVSGVHLDVMELTVRLCVVTTVVVQTTSVTLSLETV